MGDETVSVSLGLRTQAASKEQNMKRHWMYMTSLGAVILL